jgi:soluble lytic murein transglycosylase
VYKELLTEGFKMRKFQLIAALSITFVLFQNFVGFDIAFDPKYQINDDSRREHAKELLGKRYKKSLAAQFDEDNLLSIEVYNLVQSNISKKNQNKVEKITKAILEESNRYNIDPIFIASIIRTESAFNHLAKGTSGEIGLMQLMPKTGEYIAKRIKMKFYGAKTLRDPVKNIKIGAAYLNYLRQKFENKAYKYVPAYNMGPGNVVKVMARNERPKIYSAKVMKFYESFYKKISVSQMLRNPYLAQK